MKRKKNGLPFLNCVFLELRAWLFFSLSSVNYFPMKLLLLVFTKNMPWANQQKANG